MRTSPSPTSRCGLRGRSGDTYPAITDPTSSGDGEPLDSGTVSEGDSITGTAFFDVPTNADSLTLVLLGPERAIPSTWSLSAR